jgi:hypothetical protein
VRGEAVLGLDRGEHADHRAHRVADQDDRALRELVDDLEQVGRMAVQGAVLFPVVRRQVRHAAAHQVEEDRLVPVVKAGAR